MGECCENIGNVDTTYKKSGNLYCFEINTNKNEVTWKVCSDQENEANEWRQDLVLQVMLYGLK